MEEAVAPFVSFGFLANFFEMAYISARGGYRGEGEGSATPTLRKEGGQRPRF